MALVAVSGLVACGAQIPLAMADEAAESGVSRAQEEGATQKESPESLAVAEAKRSGNDVPVASLQNEMSDVLARPDGTLVATVHSKPVRTRIGGAWQAIDTSLHQAPDGAVAPKATLSELEFSGGGTQPLVRMARAGKELKLTWPKVLPAPVVNGDTAEYRSVLPDVDLRMTATDGGFRQLIVVKTAEAAKNPALDELKLGLSSANLTMRQHSDGSLSAVDKIAGGTVFEAPKPMMFDSSPGLLDGTGTATPQVAAPKQTLSSAKEAMARTQSEPDVSAHAADVAVAVPADQKSLILTPDQRLLDAPATVFPVMIDPNLDTPKAGGWAGISRYWGGNSYWKFSDDFGTGYCISSNCAPADLKRVMYSIPISGRSFVGKQILSAKLNVWETHSFSCVKKPLQLYATSRINSGTTWNNSSSSTFWSQHLQTVSAAMGYSTCAAGYVEFGGTTSDALKNKVQQAANGNWPDLTLGLKAESETDGDAWKRFNSNASVQVTYNLPPRQALQRQLTMSPGSVCSPNTLYVTKVPQVTGVVSDPDDEKIGYQFAAAWSVNNVFQRRWWSTGSEGTTPPVSVRSGTPYTITLPSSIPLHSTVGWEVRAWDGKAWGPWSSDGDQQTECYFNVDPTAPVGPVITSPSFPGSADLQTDLPATDGVGRYGTFTFASSSTDVVKYQYGLDQSPSPANEIATSGGAAKSVSLLMPRDGLHWVSARALDAAGNASTADVKENSVYYFNVRNGQPQRTGWSMDSVAGTTALPASGANLPATLMGDATLGAAGHSGTALSLPGTVAADGTPTGYAATDAAILDTDQSFTVSAWVNVADTAKGQAAVSQSGQHEGALALGLYGGKWTFKAATADVLNGYTWYSTASDVAPVTNQWTYLAGVYDATAKTMTLYVNGMPSTPATGVNNWAARGEMDFGRFRWRDTYTDAWHGSLDDIRVWDRALSVSDVSAVKTGVAINGLGAKAVWSLDESGKTMAGLAEVSDVRATGDVQTGVAGVAGKAARFGGGSGYLETDRSQVDATRSFSVSAWVKFPTLPTGDPKMVITQTGVHNSEFSLYYSVWQKKWAFGRYQSDAANAPLTAAVQTNCTPSTCATAEPGEWTHLVGQSDAVAHKLRLYVNGVEIAETDYTQTTPWPKPGGLRIGAVSREGAAGEFFGGDIDDVRVFDRIVTAPEVADMVQQRPQLVDRWTFNASNPADPKDFGAQALLHGQAAIGPNAAVGAGALNLSGDDADYADTIGKPLDTSRSFTVAGWAQTAGTPGKDETVLALGDGASSALTIRWQFLGTSTDPDTQEQTNTGQWQVETVSTTDPKSQQVTKVVHTFDGSGGPGYAWNHLAVSYDAFSNQLAFYVNGMLENQLCPDADKAAGTCTTDHVSFTKANQPLAATGNLMFGRSINPAALQTFSGQIDDVWAYQGVLSPARIAQLAVPDELPTSDGPN
ncbi:LamG-like jellyroll fold domain-containing protein [Streptomyces sp. NPDC055808]